MVVVAATVVVEAAAEDLLEAVEAILVVELLMQAHIIELPA